jgi:hypothetical protein
MAQRLRFFDAPPSTKRVGAGSPKLSGRHSNWISRSSTSFLTHRWVPGLVLAATNLLLVAYVELFPLFVGDGSAVASFVILKIFDFLKTMIIRTHLPRAVNKYWTVGRPQTSTDDVYIKADNTAIAPRVTG